MCHDAVMAWTNDRLFGANANRRATSDARRRLERRLTEQGKPIPDEIETMTAGEVGRLLARQGSPISRGE